MLTHRGLLHAAAVRHIRLTPTLPRYLCNLPVNHVGCLMNFTLAARVGGSVVFLQRFSAAASLQLIRDERVNCWLQVPAMHHECVRDPSFDPQALRHLHSICIGRFDPYFEFRIADAENRPCAVDEGGEIQGRGQLIFAGCYADPSATSEAFTADGWLRTGDLTLQRSDDNMVLQGRLKEMIKTGGYNVYPREIEQVIETHPGISQVVVLPLPDEHHGDAVHAVISYRDGPMQPEALAALCRRNLANYKVPKSFRVVQAFPLLANGKIDRVGARAMAAGLLAPE